MTKTNKITYTIAAIFAVIVFVISSLWGGGVAVVHAATSTTTAFEQTDVMDDLKSSDNFNILNYPYDSTGIIEHPEIMTVVEYCYSVRTTRRDNYGLYVYFYNPQGLNISTTSSTNKITLGVKYSTDKDGFTKVDDYEKFDLQFCSKSTGNYRDLFYKFKVIDHKSAYDGKTIAERVNSNARRYDISEVELLTYGNKNATAYGVGGTYTFTGYAKGYGIDENAESTLACERKDLETITLDLAGKTDGVDKRTFWRSESVSSLGAGHQNQINSVYFAIDNSVLEKYGYILQKIKAEWTEYKTAPTVVLDNEQVYNSLKKYSGMNIGNNNYDLGYYIECQRNVDTHGSGFLHYADYYYSYTWNRFLSDIYVHPDNAETTVNAKYISDYNDTLLPLLFYTGGIALDDYTITADTLQAYCDNYTKSYEKGHLQFGEHDYSADLFIDSVDDGRTRGYNCREFDISNPDDYYNLKSYDSTHNWLQKLGDFGFGSINTSDEYLNVAPIEMVTDAHIASKNISNDLKINPDDVKTFKDFYTSSTKNDKTVFIFHYAFLDYYADVAQVYYTNDTYVCEAEIRQGTQIFDFDILTMTFNKNGVYTTLGCVSSPVDHWTGYSPALRSSFDWLKLVKIILAILAVILLLVLLYPVISPILGFIVKGLLWLITAPFKAIGALFKGIGKAANKRKRGK